MKISKLGQKLKASIRKHYVRKKDFEALSKEVKRLKKRLSKLERCCESPESGQADSKTKPKKAEKNPSKAKVASVADAPPDKLTNIKGIGPVLEKKLHGLGITSFSQIAAWSETDIETVSENLSFKGRIQREGWVEQATNLAS